MVAVATMLPISPLHVAIRVEMGLRREGIPGPGMATSVIDICMVGAMLAITLMAIPNMVAMAPIAHMMDVLVA